MEKELNNPGKKFYTLALILLSMGLIGGLLASLVYVIPEFLRDSVGFTALRPIHVSSVMFWIILGATGVVYSSLFFIKPPDKKTILLSKIQLILWLLALIGVFGSYLSGNFGGREYWEFHPIWALPILISWVLFLINFIRIARGMGRWPVYVWMWMTGIVFFLFIFLENYLWIFPYFRENLVTDMTIQWKVNGSLVGALNQLLYGTSFYLMDRLSDNEHQKVGFSKLAFAMYFLGLTNLMFNWGHHIYTLPTDSYVRYVAYIVSMTEWVFFLKTINNWSKQLDDIRKNYHYFPYRFLMASEFWVFVNLCQALLMSIPAINLYTHGTHVTVAHSMGTTIGINTMILLSAGFTFFAIRKEKNVPPGKLLKGAFWGLQGSLLLLFIALDVTGVYKGIWQLDPNQIPFGEMMNSLWPWFLALVVAGGGILFSLSIFIIHLLKNTLKKSSYE